MKRIVKVIINGKEYKHVKSISMGNDILEITYSPTSYSFLIKKEKLYISKCDIEIKTCYIKDEKMKCEENDIHKPTYNELKDLFKHE